MIAKTLMRNIMKNPSEDNPLDLLDKIEDINQHNLLKHNLMSKLMSLCKKITTSIILDLKNNVLIV